MNSNFPLNQDVEKAQEKILQAKSAQEIKDLLKQDDPRKPNYQEGLIRLVSQHIMEKFTPEEVNKVENTSFRNLTTNGEPPFSQERSAEFSKLASKMDSEITFSIVNNAAQKHDPYMVSKDKRDFFQPPSSVELSIANAVLDHVKNYSPTIDNIFADVLPKIKQEKNLDNQFVAKESEKTNEIKIAQKAGYVQGVCECVVIVGNEQNLGKKLLSEMNVTKDMAQKFAKPETFKILEQSIFATKPVQNLEQTQEQGLKR